MMIYFQRIMLPAITAPVMRDVVDPRLLYSWELIAKPEGSTPTDVKLWRLEQPLPTSMGGADIGGSERNCNACFASSILACAARLSALPGYAGVDPARSRTLDHGMFAAARAGNDATIEDHRLIARAYAKFDKQPYYTLRGGKIAGLYRPGKLARALVHLSRTRWNLRETFIHPRSGPLPWYSTTSDGSKRARRASSKTPTSPTARTTTGPWSAARRLALRATGERGARRARATAPSTEGRALAIGEDVATFPTTFA